jgi:hypothetical protein
VPRRVGRGRRDPFGVVEPRWVVAARGQVGIHYEQLRAKSSEAPDPPDGDPPKAAPFTIWRLSRRGVPRRRRHRAVDADWSRIAKVVPTADGRWAVMAGWGSLRIFGLHDGRQQVRLEGHTGPVWDVDLLEEAGVLVSGSEDATVRVWELATGAHLAAFRGESPIGIVRAALVDGFVTVFAGEASGRAHVLRLRGREAPAGQGAR